MGLRNLGQNVKLVHFLFFSITLSLFSSILVILVLLLRNVQEKSSNQLSTSRNKYYQFNPRTNETSVGFVTINQQLEIDEYIFYEEPSGGHTLISNFGSQEYMCTGSCICEKIDDRRSTLTLTRGIMYLVASVSSLIAYNKAREHFKNECEERLQSATDISCSSSTIKSEIDSCEPIVEEAEEVKDNSKKSNRDIRKFFCTGTCIKKDFKDSSSIEKARVFGCEKFRKDAQMEVDLTNMEKPNINLYVRRKFQEDHMVKFCRKKGQHRYLFTHMYNKGGKTNKQWKTAKYCRHNFPAIDCKQTDPVPKPVRRTFLKGRHW